MKALRLRKFTLAALTVALFGLGGAASASTMALTDATRCGAGNAINGISTGDVTGNAGGASECWGTFDGNDPGPGGAFEIGTMTYDFVAKKDIGGALSGADIGLSVGSGSSGTWAFDATKWAATGLGDFIIVLKAASSPGFASWLFEGAFAASTSGDWAVAWTNDKGKPRDLSHFAVYAKAGIPNDDPPPVPLPAAGWLVLTGLGGLVLTRRRKKS